MTLEILTADVLTPARHGFFTRRGGASSGVYAGLNCGYGSDDQRAAVRLNRARVARAMAVTPDALRTVHQVHSARVVEATAETPETPAEADAMVTRAPGVALGILTADCMPVLFHDAEAGVAGAAHAGWRGTLAGVMEATLEAMEALGARRKRITAAIGPAISQDAYEVGPEVRDTFLAADAQAAPHFEAGAGDRFLLDLPGYGLARLARAGVARAAWIGRCTYADPDRFYSYRRTTHLGEADYGRLISAIRAR